jgi:transposase-like protein
MQVKRRRHTPEQIIRKLREAEKMLGEGKQIPEVAKQLGVSEQTFHRWRNQYGGMKADDVKRLKQLEKENRELKQIVADKELDIRAYKEIAKGRMKVIHEGAGPCQGEVMGHGESATRAGGRAETSQSSIRPRDAGQSALRNSGAQSSERPSLRRRP